MARESRCEHGKLYAEFCWDCVDRSAAVAEMHTCDHCGNVGYADSWPFVRLSIVSLTDSVDDEMMLCADCTAEFREEGGGDGA